MVAHFRITGHVQGVGFRSFVSDLARLNSWTGEVWNTRDRAVEAIINAEIAADLVADMLQDGPGRVELVTWTEGEFHVTDGFRIGYTR